jgi:hypothetical protein
VIISVNAACRIPSADITNLTPFVFPVDYSVCGFRPGFHKLITDSYTYPITFTINNFHPAAPRDVFSTCGRRGGRLDDRQLKNQ